ncbi:TPR-like protein [Pluteus cervinus]|uniref:TPR-like protein n=1 Tax=Pluteus cervinus TaxID=181527 RepID=A0ACD3BAE6_9AGAR|nr:TPR-like protein [Pluteus cervinus]
MSSVKASLKRARDAIGKKDYPTARDASNQVLEYEPENYNAHVFLALSLLELKEHDASEQAYQMAIKLQPDQVLAWQGIVKFYERLDRRDKYAESLEGLMLLYSKQSDAQKCAEIFQKLLEERREHGTRLQLISTLTFLLHSSPIYPTLSTLPPPDLTNPSGTTIAQTQTAIHNTLPVLEEIIQLIEKDEADVFKKELDTRRMRLNAPPLEQLKLDIGREIWGQSKLPTFYGEAINHPDTTDDQRRETEGKLLRYKQQYLYSVPNAKEHIDLKTRLREEVNELINGIVILEIPDEEAWMTYLNGIDHQTLGSYDREILGTFVTLFPASPLTVLLRGYCAYLGLPWYIQNEEDESIQLPPEEVGFELVLTNQETIPHCHIANKALVELYLEDDDYANAVRSVEVSLGVIAKDERRTGRPLPNLRLGFKTCWATALVHLFPPKHHTRALSIIDDVLTSDPESAHCLMGRAYILETAEQWREAVDLFDKVSNLLPEDRKVGLRAREEAAWCQFRSGELQSAIATLQGVLDSLKAVKEDRSLDVARCLWRLGTCHWDLDGGLHKEDAYKYFISSLKANSSFAPAFTSLGIYYGEFADPPDPTRAAKCFQKAFELDAREVEAAQRLARSFADDKEWDLVEVVAKRTIEGEGGLDAGLGTETRYLPTNAWAWKALGVVELLRGDSSGAIQAFQIALRANPDDQLSWLRLGESYGRGGRHAAALKALNQALQLDASDWLPWFLIGEVYSRMGLYGEAIGALDKVLESRPDDTGVLLSQAQCYLARGRVEMGEGFYVRAEQSLVGSIRITLAAIEGGSGFGNVGWKTVADCIYLLSKRSAVINEEDVRSVLADVIPLLLPHSSDRILTLVPPLNDGPALSGAKLAEIAIVAYDYRLALIGTQLLAKPGAWFDLGIALHSLSRKRPENSNSLTERAIQCLKNAIREQPDNGAYWLALGDAYFLSHARLAQHSYIKALEIDRKSAVTWTRLGLLYLHHDDPELANQAFYRAQTIDAEYAMPWVGQALVATANRHGSDAISLLQHAVTLSSPVPDADLEYASRVFSISKSLGAGKQPQLDSLLPAFFALTRYCEYQPLDPSGLHLLGLVHESLGHLERGAELLERAIGLLEAAYEETEDAEIEKQFTFANLNLGRLRLGLEDYDRAIELYESVLGLLGEEADSTPYRAQAQLGLGVANFLHGDLQAGLGHLEIAVENSDGHMTLYEHAAVLQAKVMWAIGTPEFKEAAQTRLLDCITTNSENLAAINALAGIGILMHDDTLVDAALTEILALPPDRRRELDPARDVDYLLVRHSLEQGDIQKAISIAKSAVEYEPTSLKSRNALAELLLQDRQDETALAALEGDQPAKHDDSKDVDAALCLQSVALSRSGTNQQEAIQKAQKAVIRSPWEIRHWQTLAYAKER